MNKIDSTTSRIAAGILTAGVSMAILLSGCGGGVHHPRPTPTKQLVPKAAYLRNIETQVDLLYRHSGGILVVSATRILVGAKSTYKVVLEGRFWPHASTICGGVSGKLSVQRYSELVVTAPVADQGDVINTQIFNPVPGRVIYDCPKK